MKHTTTHHSFALSFALCLLLLAAAKPAAFAQSSTTFSYQGRLQDNGIPANGAYDLQFALFDAASGGTQQGATLTRDDMPVTNGVFTVSLDFGVNAFPGAPRFLQISVRPGASSGAFTLLNPRQPLSATPYAIRSASAAAADNATQLGGVAASQYVQTADTRLSDARTPTAGSASYIQNSTAQQAASNFNISGDGTAGGTLSGNVVNAAAQFNLNGQRILSNAGTSNLFAGTGTAVNSTGSNNAFFGADAGHANTSGSNNVFAGGSAGFFNTSGYRNVFVGLAAGQNNTTGGSNVFVGIAAGRGNTTGTYNTLLGSDADVGNSGLSFATAIGAGATVSTSNTIVLGRGNGSDTVYAPGPIAANGGLTATGAIVANSGINLRNGLVLNDYQILLRDSNDPHHGISYDRTIDGIRFDAFTQFSWQRTGNIRVELMRLNGNGVLRASGGFNGRCVGGLFVGDGYCNQDLAETFRTKEQTEAGDVVTLIPQDHARPTVRRSLRAYDEHLVGVVSSNPGLVFDEGETRLAGANDHYITKDKTVVAAVGRVPVKFTLENGAINVGDALTSSATEPGKAMKATGAGKIIGIALESSAKAKDGPTKDKLLMWLQVGDQTPPQQRDELQTIKARLNTVIGENAELKTQLEQLRQIVCAANPAAPHCQPAQYRER